MRNVILFALGLASCVGLANADECLKEGDTVILSGSVRQKVYPGPPNYYSIQQGDAAEAVWILLIDGLPKCMTAHSQEDGSIYTLSDKLDGVQLAFDAPAVATQYAPLVGHHVQAVGQLHAGINGHAHMPAILGVEVMKKTFPW